MTYRPAAKQPPMTHSTHAMTPWPCPPFLPDPLEGEDPPRVAERDRPEDDAERAAAEHGHRQHLHHDARLAGRRRSGVLQLMGAVGRRRQVLEQGQQHITISIFYKGHRKFLPSPVP